MDERERREAESVDAAAKLGNELERDEMGKAFDQVSTERAGTPIHSASGELPGGIEALRTVGGRRALIGDRSRARLIGLYGGERARSGVGIALGGGEESSGRGSASERPKVSSTWHLTMEDLGGAPGASLGGGRTRADQEGRALLESAGVSADALASPPGGGEERQAPIDEDYGDPELEVFLREVIPDLDPEEEDGSGGQEPSHRADESQGASSDEVWGAVPESEGGGVSRGGSESGDIGASQQRAPSDEAPGAVLASGDMGDAPESQEVGAVRPSSQRTDRSSVEALDSALRMSEIDAGIGLDQETVPPSTGSDADPGLDAFLSEMGESLPSLTFEEYLVRDQDDLLAPCGAVGGRGPDAQGAMGGDEDLERAMEQAMRRAFALSEKLRRESPELSALAGLEALHAHIEHWVSHDVITGGPPREEHWADAVSSLLYDELVRRVRAHEAVLPEQLERHRSLVAGEDLRVRAAGEFLRRIGATTRDRHREHSLESQLHAERQDQLRGVAAHALRVYWPTLYRAVASLRAAEGLLLRWPGDRWRLDWVPHRESIGERSGFVLVVVASRHAQEVARTMRARYHRGGGALEDSVGIEGDDAKRLVGAVGIVLCDSVSLQKSSDGTPYARVCVRTLGGSSDEIDLSGSVQRDRARLLAHQCGVPKFTTLLCAPLQRCDPVDEVEPSLQSAALERGMWFDALLKAIDCEALCVLED